MIRRLLMVGAAAAALSGCISLEPKYQRPAAPTSPTFPQGGVYPSLAPDVQPAAADIAWRDFFTDPRLRMVIQQALEQNRDLRVAVLNIEEARAQFRIQRADLFPTVNGDASGTYEETSKAVSGASQVGTGGTGTGAGGTGSTVISSDRFQRIYSVSAGVSAYELDLWGRVRSLSKEAYEQYLASEEARRTSQISLIAEVAIDYLTYGADLQRLRIAQETLAAQTETLRISQGRFTAGVASELDVHQAETAVEQSRSDAAVYSAQVAQDRNALELVVGSPVADDLLPGGQDESIPTLADVPAGLSSSILLSRPDVLQAEHNLKAYNADIGAARAAFFPVIALTGSGGSTSSHLADLFSGGTGTWSFAPSISLPIFDGGRNLGNLRYARAAQKVAAAQYEHAIQTAFREVADALAQRGSVGEQLSAQEALVKASSGSLFLAQARYRSGIDPYLDTLDAQRTLYAAQQTLVSARLTRSTNLVTLYRTLGGGGL